jgi:hypothetical protein
MQRICEEDLPCNIICISAPSIFISIMHPSHQEQPRSYQEQGYQDKP